MSNSPIQDEPYLIAMDAFHAGSMGQAGKTINSQTVKKWTDRIEAYKDNALNEMLDRFSLAIGKNHTLFGHGEDWYGSEPQNELKDELRVFIQAELSNLNKSKEEL